MTKIITKKTFKYMGVKETPVEKVTTTIYHIDDFGAIKLRIPFLSNFVDTVKEKLRGKKPGDGKIYQHEVSSSMIKFIVYNSDTEVLMVVFFNNKTGRYNTYIYYNVDLITYRLFVSAPSHGKYFWKFIRDDYDYEKLN